MKRVLAALAVVGAQPLLAYSDPAPQVPTCTAPAAVSHPRAEPEPSVASDKGSQNPVARSMLAAGLVTAAAANAPGTPAAQAPVSSSQQSNFNGMSKSIIQNIRARGSNSTSDPVSPAPGDNSADSQATGSAARLNTKPQATVVVPISSRRDRTAVTCTGTAVTPTAPR